jgi:hypothetical protein
MPNELPVIPDGYRLLALHEVVQYGDLWSLPDAPEPTIREIAEESERVWQLHGQLPNKDVENWLEAKNRLLLDQWRPVDYSHIGERYWDELLIIREKEAFNSDDETCMFHPVNIPVVSIKSKILNYLKVIKTLDT